MIQPTDYEFSTANTSDAEIVRRFLAKAYGGSHPAMEALDRIEPRTAPPEPTERLAIVRPAKTDFREGAYDCSTGIAFKDASVQAYIDADDELRHQFSLAGGWVFAFAERRAASVFNPAGIYVYLAKGGRITRCIAKSRSGAGDEELLREALLGALSAARQDDKRMAEERRATLHGDFGAMECNTVNPTTGGYHD